MPVSTQSEARRWRTGDVHHYQVTLEAPTGTVSVSVPPGKNRAVFSNLCHGTLYRVSLEAWGSPGGLEANTLLNANHPATASFDFTLPTDPEDVQSWPLALILDDVPFSGTLRVVPKNLPTWAKTLDLDLLREGLSCYSVTYPVKQALTLSRLKAGVGYEVRLSAKSGKRVQTAIARTLFDPSLSAIEQEKTLEIAF